ncbi:MAG: FHA domain-containing protein, partial [Anaerolineae bacterium]|nr:FHA domain-containing protein [Anaerolineae bacterium]
AEQQDMPLPTHQSPSLASPGTFDGDATMVGGYATQQEYAQTQMESFPPPQQTVQPSKDGSANPPAYTQQASADSNAWKHKEEPSVGYGAPSLLQACFTMPGSNAVLSLVPGKNEYIIGREDPLSSIFPDIDLTDYGGDAGGVSRQHARVTVEGNQFYLTDLQSTNFTYINQQRLQPNHPTLLHNGDEVQLGKVKMIFSV